MAQDAEVMGEAVLRRVLSDLAALAKLPISALSTLTAVAGFAAFARELRAPLLPALLGTFLLAAAAAALNEVLERERDGRMARTRDRPLPSGRLGAGTAVTLASASALAGAALLWRSSGPVPALLGVAALAWYDAVYTPLKRATAFAVLPGAVVGALPPAIGWTAAGGSLGDPRLHALCAVLLLWQVPHFWLLALRHADDYARGGFPTLAGRLSPPQIARITFAWILSMAASALLLPVFGVTRARWSGWAIAAAALWVLVDPIRLLRAPADRGRVQAAFLTVNRFVLGILAVLVIDALG